MSLESLVHLDEGITRAFIDRKTKGRLDLVYDVEHDTFYCVPKDIEHKEFMPQIESNPEALIPVQLRLEESNRKYIVRTIFVGVSSYEAELGIRHPTEYLKRAYDASIMFLAGHENFELDPVNFKIFFTYAKKGK